MPAQPSTAQQQDTEDQQDHTAAQVASALLTLYLGYLAARGVASAPVKLSRASLQGALLPLLVPFTLSQLAAQLPPGRQDVSNWRHIAERAAQDAIMTALAAYEPFIAKADEQTGPPTDDDSLHIYVEGLAHSIVTSTVETAKSVSAPSMGFTHKRWRTQLDPKVRSDHQILEGTEQLIGQPFTTRGGSIQFPGDKSAPIGLWINCRCHLEYFSMEDSLTAAFNPRQPRDHRGRWSRVAAMDRLISKRAGKWLHHDPHAEGESWGDDYQRGDSYGVVTFNKHGEVMMREPLNHFGGYAWTFAKGKPDKGEHPAQSALREHVEETKLLPNIVGMVPGGHSSSPDPNGPLNFFYLGTTEGATDHPDMDNGETSRTVWVPPQTAHVLIDQSPNERGRDRDHGILDAALGEWNRIHGRP